VLAVATDAVLVAHHLPKLGAHLVTALARLHVRSEEETWRREHAGAQGRGGA
jgi:hypothetical protein